nr:MAG TPA: hypothetical protein [Caudoviricetes sp.]
MPPVMQRLGVKKSKRIPRFYNLLFTGFSCRGLSARRC